MKLTLGFSPCPNDTFIFDALIHHKIDTEGLDFDVEYHDVEKLNQQAFNKRLDVTKLSYHAFAYAIDDYELLDAGSALGFGVGPLLISKNEDLANKLAVYSGQELPEEYKNLKIGIPGKYTTANFLLAIAFPALQNKEILVFSDIESALLNDEIDLGLIIHENRFTYQNKGLHKIVDLGDFWEKTTESPIPLGGIVIRRDLPEKLKMKVNRLIRKSVEFAFENPQSGLAYIRSHAQAMEDSVLFKHIDLYVNQYSIDLGLKGKEAVKNLFEKASQQNLIPSSRKAIFLT